MKRIDNFRGNYGFLSNFYSVKIKYEGIKYPSSENAYQAAKTNDTSIRKIFKNVSASESKYLGNKLKIVENWDDIKKDVMYEILKIKFNNKEMKKLLLATENLKLKEGNAWHDNYWGDCVCDGCKHIKGKNILGKLLMKIREELK